MKKNTEKRDFKFDKRADKYDDHFEGKLSKRFCWHVKWFVSL